MNKTIIAVYGRANEGKSETIKKVCRLLLNSFPNAVSFPSEINYNGDVCLTIKLDKVRIGIESQGDPNSRMVNTIGKLAEKKCDIIICATRTSGSTVNKVDEIAKNYNYKTVWLSTYLGQKKRSQYAERNGC